MPQTENIGDLLLQQLNDPQKMQQLGQMLSSLGLGGPANAQTNAQQASSGQGSSEPNLSALLSALQQQMENGSSGQNQPSQAPAGANLSALLSTLQQQMENGSKGNSASDLSSLLLALQQGAAQNGTNSAGQAPSGADRPAHAATRLAGRLPLPQAMQLLLHFFVAASLQCCVPAKHPLCGVLYFWTKHASDWWLSLFSFVKSGVYKFTLLKFYAKFPFTLLPSALFLYIFFI